MERARLKLRYRQQLRHETGEPVGLLDDDAQARVGVLFRELGREAADGRQRRLEVVADAAQELLLELGQALHLAEELGRPDSRRQLHAEDAQEVGIGFTPLPRRDLRGDQTSDLVIADGQGCRDLEGFARDPFRRFGQGGAFLSIGPSDP